MASCTEKTKQRQEYRRELVLLLVEVHDLAVRLESLRKRIIDTDKDLAESLDEGK